MRKSKNWLVYSDLLLKSFNQLSRNQVEKLATKTEQVYVAESRELFSFFSDCIDLTYN